MTSSWSVVDLAEIESHFSTSRKGKITKNIVTVIPVTMF